MKPQRLHVPLLGLIVALWAALLAAGFFCLLRYKATAGEQGHVASQWPRESKISPVPDTCNLIVALHPHCPCSRATARELERLLATCGQHVHVHVLAFRPASFPDGWEQTTTYRDLQRLASVSMFTDVDGAEAARFGARTSGDLILYGKQGELLFRGGITTARGHEGDCPAHEALADRIMGRARDFYSAPVFGCPLHQSDCSQEPQ